MAHTTSGGFVAPGWEPVRAAFERNFELGEDVGASAAVYHRGQRVVDIWGGAFVAGGDRPYDDSTLQLMFSTTKGIVAIAVAMCAQRGLIDYDAKVATYWPEFAAHGKGDATVAQLLSHQCGLIAPDAPVTLADALDWKTITTMLADTKPDWPIGTGHGYHAVTFGWLAGELIRRTDGRSPGQFLADEIAGPLDVDLWIGLPEEMEDRVSPIIGRPLNEDNPEPDHQGDARDVSRAGDPRWPRHVPQRCLPGGRRVQSARRARRRNSSCQRRRYRGGACQGICGRHGRSRRRAPARPGHPRSCPHDDHTVERAGPVHRDADHVRPRVS